MRKLFYSLVRVPILGRFLLMMFRAKNAFRYHGKTFFRIVKWLFTSRETTNYTFDLEERNMQYLACLVSDIAGIPIYESRKYMDEILHDTDIKRHISSLTAMSDYAFMADKEVKFSKRIGWYMFVRATKPKVVVETGVDKGLGSCVLTAALKRNADEGCPGKYFGTDINPKAGYLLSGPYKEFGEILYGDSIESLSALDEKIDLFINDSDHSADYEAEEYVTITPKLSEKSIILGDNSHANSKLMEYSIKNNRRFVLFNEQPLNHWYPGGGIGISW